jgi:hypothetical protein
LEPLLFIIYINDLPLCINKLTNVTLFADDTNILVADKSRNDLKYKINHALSHVINWFTGNKLVLNITKTNTAKFSPIHCVNTQLEIAHNNMTIREVFQTKFLGM